MPLTKGLASSILHAHAFRGVLAAGKMRSNASEPDMITDWDDAYTNGAYIENGGSYPEWWQSYAKNFRATREKDRLRLDIAYGPGERHRLDLFLPGGEPVGLFVFIHGGYWLRFDKSYWSHLAAGALEHGWAVAMPSYSLAPRCSVAQITADVGIAVSHAASLVKGPMRLAGHSAGGHLATRMVCRNSPLLPEVLSRIEHVMSISGLHDLRPLQNTTMGRDLFRTPEEAWRESPALLEPIQAARVTCWVGSDERPEFLRQNDLLTNIWTGLGANITSQHAATRHHFNVIDDLRDPKSEMTKLLLAA